MMLFIFQCKITNYYIKEEAKYFPDGRNSLKPYITLTGHYGRNSSPYLRYFGVTTTVFRYVLVPCCTAIQQRFGLIMSESFVPQDYSSHAAYLRCLCHLLAKIFISIGKPPRSGLPWIVAGITKRLLKTTFNPPPLPNCIVTYRRLLARPDDTSFSSLAYRALNYMGS